MKYFISVLFAFIFTVLQLVDGYACNLPNQIFLDSTDASRAWVRWNTVPTALQYQLSFRIIGNPTWQTVNINAPDTVRLIANLDPGTNYEYRLRTKCSGNQFSAWSTVQNFNTLSCTLPATFTVGTITESTVDLSWSAAANATAYRLRYRPVGNANWSNVTNITQTNRTLTGLNAGI